MHALVIAAFAVSTAVAQVPEGSTGQPAAAPAAVSAADQNAANIAVEGDARWGLVGVSTAAGLGFYGWLLPLSLNLQNPTQFAGVYLLTGAASFFIPFALTLNTPITWGAANMLYGGAFHGPGHAQAFLSLINYQEDINNFTFQPRAAVSLLFGAAEMAGGVLWANMTGMSAGTAHAIIVGSDIGAGVAGAVAILITFSATSTPLQVPAGLALAGSAGGIVAGSIVGPMLHLTWGDAELLWISTLLGAYVTVPFVSYSDTADIRPYAGLALVGAAGGAVAGYYLLQGLHLELGQAVLIDLGTLAGGLVGLGTSLILGGTSNSKVTLTATMVGAVGGFAISYVAMRSQSQQMKRAGANMQVLFNPMALADVITPHAPVAAMARRAGERPPPALAFVGSF
jgi:hypothetical protein